MRRVGAWTVLRVRSLLPTVAAVWLGSGGGGTGKAEKSALLNGAVRGPSPAHRFLDSVQAVIRCRIARSAH